MQETDKATPAIWLHCQPESETNIPITRLTERSKVGRHPDCDIHIESQFVSRFHAELFFQDDAWWIKDLDSANGVFIDKKKTKCAKLSNQCTLALGTRIAFKIFIDQV